MEGSFDNTFSLYLLDGTKILTVNAGMGILIMALYFGLLLPQEDFHLVEELRQSGPSQWFSLLFAPVCGVAVFIDTKLINSYNSNCLNYNFFAR